MREQTKIFCYAISQLVFQWSLVYLLVLFFLEDLKPFLISSNFSPHWIIIVILLAAAGLVYFSHSLQLAIKSPQHQVTRLDNWLSRILSVGVALFWFSYLLPASIFWAIVWAVIIYYFLNRLTKLLIRI